MCHASFVQVVEGGDELADVGSGLFLRQPSVLVAADEGLQLPSRRQLQYQAVQSRRLQHTQGTGGLRTG